MESVAPGLSCQLEEGVLGDAGAAWLAEIQTTIGITTYPTTAEPPQERGGGRGIVQGKSHRDAIGYEKINLKLSFFLEVHIARLILGS